MSAAPQFDVAVIGLGAMGTAAVHHLAARGATVVGLERFGPMHARGSSHGDSRLIRLGYFEDPAYVPLLQRAYENWRALEATSGEDILTVTGVLQIGMPDCGIVSGSLSACQLHDLPHEVLDRDAMAARYPQFVLSDEEIAVFDPAGGFVRPETAMAAMWRAAAARGARLRFGERVAAIEPDDAGVTIRTGTGDIRARRVVVATGSHIAELVPRLRDVANPIRQVVGWFSPKPGAAVGCADMPCYLRDIGEAGSFFGFPDIGTGGLKFGRHCHFRESIDPEADNPPVNDADRALLADFGLTYLTVTGEAADFTTCRYTLLPGEDFLIDRLPGESNVIAASPCSGHGFKFVSVVGEILADLALDGGTALPVDPFSFEALDRHCAARA